MLEDARGRLVDIEPNSAQSIGAGHFRGLEHLAEATGSRFVRGVLLYRGAEPIAFGPRLDALPFESLWRARA